MNSYFIIVAGGSGMRMGGELPKQFMMLGGRAVLMRTLDRLHEAVPLAHCVVVLPADHIAYWDQLCASSDSVPRHSVVAGGATRFDSVRCGLKAIGEVGIVGVHDGVRPFVSIEVVRACMAVASSGGSAIPVIDSVDSLRRVDEDFSYIVPRSEYRLVQTPQCFPVSLIRRAYEQPYQPIFTDDASVVEGLDVSIELILGNRENIKLTTPFDWVVANALLST